MAQVLKRRRLVNPGRRRAMTAKQIKYFGTARQRAALKHRRRRNAGAFSIRKTKKVIKKRSGRAASADWSKRFRAYKREHNRGRRRNQGDEVSSVVGRVEHAAERAIDRIEDLASEVLSRGIANRGRRRNPSIRKTKRALKRSGQYTPYVGRSYRRVGRITRSRRRLAAGKPFTREARRAMRGFGGRRSRYRRNPGGLALTGNTAAVVGILGGATVTKIITGFLPSNLTGGFTGMLTTAAVAMVTGNVTGRMLKNRSLGNWMTVGGLLIVGLQLAGQLFPQLQLPFGLSTAINPSGSGTSGLGLISSSNFYVPQVNLPGSMASFVTPAGIPAPVVVAAPATSGLGASVMNQGLRRMGRRR